MAIIPDEPDTDDDLDVPTTPVPAEEDDGSTPPEEEPQ